MQNRRITDGNYDKSIAVKCVNGTFVGSRTDGVIVYRGIPFVSRQPVGELRWKAPEEFVRDDGVYEAYYNGKSPCQHKEFSDVEETLINQGEDCLYLNVWKAADASSEKKPVMVWIHGGAFEFGAAAFSLFDCDNFIRENPDVIVVTVAYRLGVFGYFHLSHLQGGEAFPDAQNLGPLDQLMGLKWVHENIAAFGGDPDNVTIYGESAGAGSVSTLPLLKGSHAYFKRIIAQSGSPTLTRSAEEAIECTNTMMDVLGCKTIEDLDWFYAVLGDEGMKILYDDRKARKFDRLPEKERDLIENFLKNVKGEGSEAECRLFDQLWFNAPVMRMGESQAKAGGRAFIYYFTAEPGHGVELEIVFHHQNKDASLGKVFDDTFAKTMRKMWVQFAKTGNPSLAADISPDGKEKAWPLYDSENRRVMVLDEFDIHPEKEADRKIVDWDRTYGLTKYYLF